MLEPFLEFVAELFGELVLELFGHLLSSSALKGLESLEEVWKVIQR